MGQVREEVESKILEKYREKGTITEDEIVDICLDYDLNLIEIDSICERIFSKKVIVSDDYERKNTNDEKEPSSSGRAPTPASWKWRTCA